MKLNRTASNWTSLERDKINENWSIIEGSHNKLEDEFEDVVGKITDEVVGHLIDSAKLIWKEPVDTVDDLPANAEVGETRMVREADPDGISYVYRYDGENWEKIQAIDVTLVNEVDRRLTRQLAERAYGISSSNILPGIIDVSLLQSVLVDWSYVFIPEGVYEFTEPIELILNKPLKITSNNAVFRYIGDEHVETFFKVIHKGYDLVTDGIEFDGNKKANKTFESLNGSEEETNTPEVELLLFNTSLKNSRRVKNFSGGDNLFVRGNYREVIFEKSKSLDVTSEEGSTTPGSQGITSITCTWFNENSYVRKLVVSNSNIEGVISDEGGNVDQDGIRHLSPHHVYSESIINGGTTVKNTGGRMVKTQTQKTMVDNFTGILEEGFDGSEGIVTQQGSLVVGKIDFNIDSHVVSLIRNGASRYIPVDYITDSVTVSGNGSADQIVFVHKELAPNIDINSVNVSNISFSIPALHAIHVRINDTHETTEVEVNATNITGNITDSAIRGFTRTEGGLKLKVNANNLVNTSGIQVTPISTSVLTEMEIAGLNGIIGFSENFPGNVMPLFNGYRLNRGGLVNYEKIYIEAGSSIAMSGHGNYPHVLEMIANGVRGYKRFYVSGFTILEMNDLDNSTIILTETNTQTPHRLSVYYDNNNDSITVFNGFTSRREILIMRKYISDFT